MSPDHTSPHLMNQSVMLIRREGSTEHLFRLSLKAYGHGFLVQTAHGRRGQVLQTETRTPERIPYDQALQLFTDLRAEKTAEGYHLMEPRHGFEEQPAPSPSDRRYRPQRPTVLDIKQAGALISDRDWWLQEKYRGQHLQITKAPGILEAIDAEGRVVPLPAAVAEAAQQIPMHWIIEGVCCGETFIAFDQARFENIDLRSQAYSFRLDSLRYLLPERNPHFVVAETAEDFDAKVRLLHRLRSEHKAGIVLRKHNGVSRRAGLTVEDYSLACAFGDAQSSPALNGRGSHTAERMAADPPSG